MGLNTYKYSAISKSGQKVRGVIEGFNEMDAASRIRESCNVILKIEEENPEASESFLTRDLGGKKLNTKAFTVMCSQFAIILKAGVPIARTVELISGKITDKALKNILEKVKEDVEAGRRLSDSFEEAGDKLLPPTFIETIRAGEESGNLAGAFSDMHEHFDKEGKMKTKIRAALAYPVFVLVVAVIVVAIIMIKVVPTFTEVFSSMGTQMPLLMRVLIGISDFFCNYIWIILLIILAIFLGLRIYASSEKGRLSFAKRQLKMPMFGNIATLNSARQFANSMATLLAAGLPVTRAVSITARVISNYHISQEVGKLSAKIEEGRSLGDSMREAEIFPDILTDMTAVGESTGEMEQTLRTIGEYYDTELSDAIASLIRKIEPTLLIFIAIEYIFNVFNII